MGSASGSKPGVTEEEEDGQTTFKSAQQIYIHYREEEKGGERHRWRFDERVYRPFKNVFLS